MGKRCWTGKVGKDEIGKSNARRKKETKRTDSVLLKVVLDSLFYRLAGGSLAQ